MKHSRLGAERAEEVRRDGGRRAVGAIEGDPEPLQRGASSLSQVLGIGIHLGGVAADATELGVATARQRIGLEDEPLQLLFHLVVDLAAAGHDLQPVVVGRVMRGGDHHPSCVVTGGRREGQARGGHDPQLDDVGADCREAGRQRRH